MTGLYNIFRLLMVEQILLSPQMKRNVMINNKLVYTRDAEQVAERLKNYDLKKLRNTGKSQNFIDYYLVLSPLLK